MPINIERRGFSLDDDIETIDKDREAKDSKNNASKDKWFSRANIIAIILVVVGFIATVFITNYFSVRKNLTLTLITNEQILQKSKSSESVDGITILYNGVELLTPCLIKVSVENTGNVDVLESDFHEEFVLTLNDASIYSCDIESNISQKFREDLENNITFGNNKITISSFTLRKGESFALSVLTDSCITDFAVSERIIGMNRVTKTIVQNNPQVLVTVYFIVTCILSVIIIILIIKKTKMRTRKFRLIIYSIIFIIVFANVLIYIFFNEFVQLIWR